MSPRVEVIETIELGDRSYVVHDGHTAVVIDPQRDVDRVQNVLAALGLRCELVLETHIHNDYVTGGCALASAEGARYGVAAADAVAFARDPLRDGDERAAGRLRIQVLATPGHTATHLSYIVDDGDGRPRSSPAAPCSTAASGVPISTTRRGPMSGPGISSGRSAGSSTGPRPVTWSSPRTASAASAPLARPPAARPARSAPSSGATTR